LSGSSQIRWEVCEEPLNRREGPLAAERARQILHGAVAVGGPFLAPVYLGGTGPTDPRTTSGQPTSRTDGPGAVVPLMRSSSTWAATSPIA